MKHRNDWYLVPDGERLTISVGTGVGVTIVRARQTTRRLPQARHAWVSITGPCRYRCYTGKPKDTAAIAVSYALAKVGVENRTRFLRALALTGHEVVKRKDPK